MLERYTYKRFLLYFDAMHVVVTIPAYNEARTIGKVIADIRAALDATNHRYSVLVVDDGSSDSTAEKAREMGAVVVSNKRNLGLALTFRREMRECLQLGADVIVHTDADGQYPARFVPVLLEKIEEGYDLVLGSRFRRSTQHMPFVNRLGNIAFAKIISSLTKTRITDSTTGFRAFTREVAERIDFINTFTYTQEQIIRATREGFQIAEIGIVSQKTRPSRLFKSPWQYAFQAWINILRIYRNYNPLYFFGSIGGVLFSIGLLIGLYFVYLHLTVGIVGHVGLFFLMLTLLMSGLQIILFGFMADMLRR